MPTTYSQVTDGQYFVVEGPTGKVAFKQDNADQHWRMYLTPDAKSVKRPCPTRLWDGCFYALEDDRPVEIVNQEEAVRLAREYSKRILGQ